VHAQFRGQSAMVRCFRQFTAVLLFNRICSSAVRTSSRRSTDTTARSDAAQVLASRRTAWPTDVLTTFGEKLWSIVDGGDLDTFTTNNEPAVGFPNSGNTCYMAAALQVLLRTPSLVDIVTDPYMLKNQSDFKQLLVVTVLQDVSRALSFEGHGGRMMPHDILKRMRDQLISINLMPASNLDTQEDAGDFIMKLLDIYDPRKVPGMGTLRTQTFVGECDDVRSIELLFRHYGVLEVTPWAEGVNESVQDEPPGVPLVLLGHDESQGAIDGALESIELQEEAEAQGTQRRTCFGLWDTEPPTFRERSAHGSQNPCCKLVKRFWAIPDHDIAMFSVDRHFYEDGDYVKSNVAIDLAGDGSVELPIFTQSGRRLRARFLLTACTYYDGDATSGHWIAFARVRGTATLNESRWYKFDDDSAKRQWEFTAVRRCRQDGTFLVFERVDRRRGWDARASLMAREKNLVASYNAAKCRAARARPTVAQAHARPTGLETVEEEVGNTSVKGDDHDSPAMEVDGAKEEVVETSFGDISVEEVGVHETAMEMETAAESGTGEAVGASAP